MTEPVDIYVLPDPELFLADEVGLIPAGIPVQAFNGFFGGVYDGIASMLAARTAKELQLALRLADAQRALTGPAWVIATMTSNMPLLYGEVISNDEFVRVAIDSDPRARERIEDVNRRGWVFGRWYSNPFPEGEYGCHHRMQVVATVDEATFEQLRADGWPKELDDSYFTGGSV